MVVDPLANAAPPSSANNSAADKASKKSAMDYDTFLKLLVAQMKNQDPTEPMKATEQIAQLATFSQVEQATKTNQKLDSLLSASFLDQADAIIGRTITSDDGTVSGIVESVRVTSDGAVAKLKDGREMLLASGISIS